MGKEEEPDNSRIDWLNDHAILLGVITDDGESKYIKVEGNDMCFRDIVDMVKKNE